MQLRSIAKSSIEMLSQFCFLRALFPILKLYFERNSNNESRVKYAQRADELQRSIFFWRYAPSKYKGGLVPNLLGYQILRHVYFNLRFKLRVPIKADFLPSRFASDMRGNGFVIWPNALAPADTQAILEFFEQHKHDKMDHFEDFSELAIATSKGPIKDTDDYKRIYSLIRKACRWDEVGMFLTRKHFSISPYVAILHSKSRKEISLQEDGQDIPHADVFYPSFKAFFYLSDVDDDNGPLTYYKGSHACGPSRVLQEYGDSIRYFNGAKHNVKPMSLLRYVERRGFQKSLLSGAKGTGILFNVQGVHRRGDFRKDKDRERKALLVDFRQVEAGSQRFAA